VRVLSPQEIAQAHLGYTTAAAWCAGQLWQPDGAQARAYLHQRGLSDETIRAAGLGYHPHVSGSQGLGDALYAGNRDAYMGAQLGGILGKQGRALHMLLDAITFPYHHHGTVAMLRSRKLDPGEGPKYLAPRGTLYAGATPCFFLHAVLDQTDQVIVTEGEFKALACYQAWQDHQITMPAVATPGIGLLRDEMIDALRGKTVYLCYDSEARKDPDHLSPGEEYTIKHGERLTTRGIPVKVIRLPRPAHVAKVDLDSFLLEQGAAALQALIDQAPPFAAWREPYDASPTDDVAMLWRRLRHVEAERDELKALVTWTSQVLRSELPAPEKVTLLGARQPLAACRVLTPDRPLAVTNEHIAALTHQSPSTVSRTVRKLEAAQVWQCAPEPTHHPDGFTYDRMRLIPLPAFDDPSQIQPLPEQKSHGGKRAGAGRKPKCATCPPGTPLREKTTTTTTVEFFCEGCGEQIGEPTTTTHTTQRTIDTKEQAVWETLATAHNQDEMEDVSRTTPCFANELMVPEIKMNLRASSLLAATSLPPLLATPTLHNQDETGSAPSTSSEAWVISTDASGWQIQPDGSGWRGKHGVLGQTGLYTSPRGVERAIDGGRYTRVQASTALPRRHPIADTA
jgi:DNA primase